MKAFITGITGQDGFYLTALLKEKGYEVHGLARRTSQKRDYPNAIIHIGDVQDPSISDLIERIRPQEVYNLAAMSHVGESFKIPRNTFEINALGALNALEGARRCGAKFYQASTSELFGNSPPPQNERTRFHPRSPYGAAKLAAFYLTVNYREAYGLRASNGILFNHESPLRGEDFVTKKIAKYVGGLYAYQNGFRVDDLQPLKLGNLDAKRDWGHAKDFVLGMWMIMNNPPGDYVLATGETHTVREFAELAFKQIGENWEDYVQVDETLFRPSEVNELRGDYTRALSLGWKPEVTFRDLVKEMVEHEISNFNMG